jgi:hypothetical protein
VNRFLSYRSLRRPTHATKQVPSPLDRPNTERGQTLLLGANATISHNLRYVKLAERYIERSNLLFQRSELYSFIKLFLCRVNKAQCL